MRRTLIGLFTILSISLFVACGDDATAPPPANHNDGTIQGHIGDADFEFEIRSGEPGDPLWGPFVLEGRNLHYDDNAHVLVVDLTVKNLGSYSHHEPIGLTFIQLDPDEVSVENPDNDIHGDGAAIVFPFANDDGVWTPDEESLPRTVEFNVSKGVSIAFVARLDIDAIIDGGIIDGVVWNDTNENGVRDDDEPGVPGADVFWGDFAQEGDSSYTRQFGRVVTDAEGRYVIGPLDAGGYVVTSVSVTNECRPTTPTEIRVLLVEVDGEVSSYHGANFGCIPLWTPPPIGVGERVHVQGKFYEPDIFLTFFIEHAVCPDDSIPGPLDPPEVDCFGGRLRGPVTAVAPVRNAFKVMNTWIVTDAMNIPPDIVVGSRLDVHVHRAPERNTPWIADSIAKWDGPGEELEGRVDAVDASPDGVLRILVLDTWINVATVAEPASRSAAR